MAAFAIVDVVLVGWMPVPPTTTVDVPVSASELMSTCEISCGERTVQFAPPSTDFRIPIVRPPRSPKLLNDPMPAYWEEEIAQDAAQGDEEDDEEEDDEG